MVCNNCYYNNDDDSKFCVKCGTKLKQKVIIQNNVNNKYDKVNYLNNETIKYSPAGAIVALILSFMCCSNIAGIVFAILSLVEGAKTNSLVQIGNIRSC